MDTTELEALVVLYALLDAELLDEDDPERCPGCLAPTVPSPIGHRTYCLACCQTELGRTLVDNAYRIEFGLTWGQYDARLERYGAPWQNRHAWVTSAKKLRERRRGQA